MLSDHFLTNLLPFLPSSLCNALPESPLTMDVPPSEGSLINACHVNSESLASQCFDILSQSSSPSWSINHLSSQCELISFLTAGRSAEHKILAGCYSAVHMAARDRIRLSLPLSSHTQRTKRLCSYLGSLSL